MGNSKLVAGLIAGGSLCLAILTAVPRPAAGASASDRLGIERTGPGTFSIDVDGADVRTVCRAVAEFSGRNIVLASGVKGEITITLKNVPWEDALRTMLRSANLDFVSEAGIIRVDDATKLRSEEVERDAAYAKQLETAPLETRVVKLNYANAAELQASLQGSLTKRGAILVERRTNSLIVNDLSSNLDKVERMAVTLDSTTPQIEITAKLIDVDATALRDLGVQWNVGHLDPTLVEGPPFTPGLVPPGVNGKDPTQRGSAKQTATIADPVASVTYGILKDWGSIQAQLQVLEQNRKANIISNPRITTVDNREAKILVGQKIPLIVQDVAGNPVSQLQTIGIQLKVTPHLTQDKRVIMDLHPEVSDLSAQSTVQGGVIINTSEADTRVMVDDGQTAVIGGLIRTNDANIRTGIPLLKDIPLLGMLFRSSNVVHQNRELIIFVTPKIVNSMASN
jgi:type IV pilus assembly protein PilQ